LQLSGRIEKIPQIRGGRALGSGHLMDLRKPPGEIVIAVKLDRLFRSALNVLEVGQSLKWQPPLSRGRVRWNLRAIAQVKADQRTLADTLAGR
jgi:hypothetical protein